MCGICGVIQLEGELGPVISESTLAVMTDLMTHRGPDDRGLFQEDGIAVGVRRLSIVDVEGGHQPMSNETGDVWAAQNGELFNHTLVRDSLAQDGHTFQTRCDTEILPHLYERDGAMFPKQLRGMFGIVVWDRKRRTGVLARDRLGIKPLYYARCGSLVVFASELKSVLASGLVGEELDYEAIDAYLTLGFFPGPSTPLAGVRKLMPGHVLIAGPDGMRTERYWSYPEPNVGVRRTDEEYREELFEKLDESVRLRLMADVPLGAMLSGGLDSSLIVAMMARHMSEPVKTFSVGFVEAGPENELADARELAAFFGTDHHELELSFSDTVDLEELVWYLDEPLADLSSLGFIALCQLASKHVKVALSGQGADELFGGYAKHRAAAITGYWHRIPSVLRAGPNALLRQAPGRFSRPGRTLGARGAAERLIAMSGKLDDGVRPALLKGELAGRKGEAAYRAAAVSLGSVRDDPLSATLYIDGQLALVDDMLHYFDRASMARSLEVRVPFLDHELVEYSAKVPADLKIHRLETKYLLKQVARGIVPDRVIDKRKVGFFHGSVAGWVQAQARQAIQEHLLNGDARTADFLDQTTIRTLMRADATENDQHLLLAILMLEIWLATFLPRVKSAMAAAA